MRGSILLVLLGSLGMEAALACPACGDKLNFGGGGMGFDRARVVGHVALIATPGSQEGFSPAASDMASLLEKYGHHVELAGDVATLKQMQGEHSIDVVVVHWQQAANVASVLGDVQKVPIVLPVANDADDAAAAKAVANADCLTRLDQRRGRKLAEAVTKALEQRAKGTAPQCLVTVAQRIE